MALLHVKNLDVDFTVADEVIHAELDQAKPSPRVLPDEFLSRTPDSYLESLLRVYRR